MGITLVCLLNELKEKYRPRLVVLCTIPLKPDAGLPIADFGGSGETGTLPLPNSVSSIPHCYERL